MRLVDDDRVVAAQVAVALHLGEQDAVGHHLQPGRVAAVVGEPHLVADEVAELDLHLLGDPLGDRAGGDPPGLGVADLAGSPTAQLEAHLRQLGRLARAGLTGDDDDLVVAQRREDVVAPLDDGQVLRVPQPGRVDRVDGLGRHGAKDRSAPTRTPTGYPARHAATLPTPLGAARAGFAAPVAATSSVAPAAYIRCACRPVGRRQPPVVEEGPVDPLPRRRLRADRCLSRADPQPVHHRGHGQAPTQAGPGESRRPGCRPAQQRARRCPARGAPGTTPAGRRDGPGPASRPRRPVAAGS